MTSQTLEVKLNLSDEVYQRLQSEAQRRHIPLDEVVSTVVEEYFEDEDLSDEEILESLRQAMKEALAGDVRPAREVLAEIERELGGDADNG
jgi:predicted transcriptional regulator